MKRKHRTILFFGVCAAAVIGAMGWMTVQIGELQQREVRARREATFHQLSRVALWRMDSLALIFMATESARPHLYYNSFFSPEQAYYLTQGTSASQWTVACSDDLRVPSPLLSAEPEFCRLHFQIVTDPVEGNSVLVSPRYPNSAENREFGITTENVLPEELVKAAGLMERLKAMARPERLQDLAHAAPPAPESWTVRPPSNTTGLDPYLFARLIEDRSPAIRQQSQVELSQRRQTANQAANVQQMSNTPLSMDARAIEVSSFKPVWLGENEETPELILLRTVRVRRNAGAEELVQGVWVDWPALRGAMLEKINDIFPDAQLAPATGPSDDPERLATFPVVLAAGTPAAGIASFTSSRSAMLYVAWAGVLAALVAVGIVVRAIIDLGERRGRFVSAVTHELRTPLTTFCLYSEMLADGMVREEKARSEYLTTLKRESQRLAKIVENVLCYARLAEVRASAHTQELDAGELLDRMIPALARRCAEAGMQLVPEIDAAFAVNIEVDPQTVERIIMNLVDNACKYARAESVLSETEDNRIHLMAVRRGAEIEIVVADHGPGIPSRRRRAVFRAFNRTGGGAVITAQGLGLGLSLARGLARELGGNLRLAPLPPGFATGAVMALTLPVREAAAQPAFVDAATS